MLPQLRREVAAFGAFNEGRAEYAAGLDWARTVLPRQALSYRAGYLEFLGPGGGTLPFPALRRRVTRELGNHRRV
ncbi:hypothetical protein [Streptomyces sp. NPDC047718]|uniref:hypothetical protein n=1 Tax=Streptomyces sp. NPDC047718 TaxID=3155479 RepID=UPI003410C3AA